jgi:hypothetical protein
MKKISKILKVYLNRFPNEEIEIEEGRKFEKAKMSSPDAVLKLATTQRYGGDLSRRISANIAESKFYFQFMPSETDAGKSILDE